MSGESSRQFEIDDLNLNKDIYGFNLSPDGKRWVFISRSGEIIESNPKYGERGDIVVKPIEDLVIMSANGGYPQPLGVGNLHISRPQWSPDGQWISWGSEQGVWICSPSTGETRHLVSESVKQLSLGEISTKTRQSSGDALWASVSWSPDGQSLLYIVDKGEKQELWLVDVEGTSHHRLYSLDGRVFSRQWSPDGKKILFTSQNWDGITGGIWLLDACTGKAVCLSRELDCFYLRPLATWTPDGNAIIFRSNRSGYAKLWRMSPDGSDVQQLTFGKHDDSLFRVSPDGNLLAYASRAEQLGGDDIWLLPLSGGNPNRLTQHPGINCPLAWSPDSKTIYYFHTSPVEPGDLWSIRVIGKKGELLTQSRNPWLETLHAWPDEILIPSSGCDIYTLLYKPLDFDPTKKYPAVLLIKGGPTSAMRPAYQTEPRWLANQGYIVACPNYRGSIGFGVEYMNAGAQGQAGQTDLDDIFSVANHIKSLSYIASEKLGITGRSWGGYMTLMAITHQPDMFQCAVAHAAIYNWTVQQAEEDCRQYSYWLYGGWANEQTELYAQRSPITFAANIKTPLSITHGKADVNVPFIQVDDFLSKARAAGVRLEYRFYEGEGHGYKRPENHRDSYERTLQFLNKHLKPWNFLTNPKKGQRLE